jgi:malate permease and related proteins
MTVLIQIMALFLLMGAGFALGKLKVIDSHAIRGMSNLIVKATLPALIIMSLQKPFSRELFGESMKTLLVAFVFYLAVIALSFGTGKLLGGNRKKAGAIAFALAFSNAAFIGFPVITSILGEEALFLTSIHNIMFNILAFTVGIIVISGDAGNGKMKIPVSKIFNINVIAAILGFVLFVFSVKIPHAIALPMNMLGGLTTPLAMIVTGAMLERTPLRSVLGDWKIYAVTALRLAVWPLIAAGVLTLCGVTGQLKYISVIIAGMPAASNTSLLAEVYGGDTETASSSVFMTTLFSVASIPIMALLLV